MACSGVFAIPNPPIQSTRKPKVHIITSCSTPSSSSSTVPTSTATTTPSTEPELKKFTYSRASPSLRWPHLKLPTTHHPPPQTHFTPEVGPPQNTEIPHTEDQTLTLTLEANDESQEVLGRPSRTRAKKMTKLALKRAKDWRDRVQFLTDRILALKPEEFVADVLDERAVQMTPTDFCFVVKWVGQSNWQRGLEVYEWLNLRHWYSPNARMLATMLAVLGKANQEALAVEIFTRAESGVGNTVQVYNAMMGVYARSGRFNKVQELLGLMRQKGCEPDLVSLNTLINARLKSKAIVPNLTIELLNEVRKSGIRPDIITYNTLISACSRESNLEEAVKVYSDMEAHRCQPDLWTYNAMISVYGRCGLSSKAEQLFHELESKGFSPDAVTYNSVLYAFAREGNVEKVEEISEEMTKMGFRRDEMTYNTIIHMFGKHGQRDLALKLYRDMKGSGLKPDAITYTVVVDLLGKANMISEATEVMSEMLNEGVKPTLRTYSALICGYAKVGKREEAEDTFKCMLKSGIKPDHLAYSVMLDILLRSNETKKAMTLYHEMVRSGFRPDQTLYEVLFQALAKENKEEDIQKIVKDMEALGNLNPQIISSILVKGECYDQAAQLLKKAIVQDYDLDTRNLLSILSSYSSSGRNVEALQLLHFVREHAPRSHQLISEAEIIIHCKAHQLDEAFDEYHKAKAWGRFDASPAMYESLIKCCEENELFAEASQVFNDMRFYGVEPSKDLCESMVLAYCRMGFPETAHYLLDEAEAKGNLSDTILVYACLIEAYGKFKQLEKAESLVGILRQRFNIVDRKVWNALIHAYAACGCYEKARAAFNTMMRDGPSPTIDTMNGLMQALITSDRLDELYVVIEELQDMGFQISKSSILLMLDAFARAGNIFEVKKIYHGMKAAGYFPSMHLYRVMIELFSKGKRVRDVEAMVSEMEEAGFKPDLSIFNSLLKLYTEVEDFKKTVKVYQKIREAGFQPDEGTYNSLILMYCRDCRPEQGLQFLDEMRSVDLKPRVSTYKSLIAALVKQQLVEQAEELFQGLLSEGYKLDRSFYHIMMKAFRSSGDHSKAEKLLVMMKEAGIEPTTATMHMLMISYGSSGQPHEAEKVLNNLKLIGADVTLPYSSVIDGYLKNGDYSTGIQKLQEMKNVGPEPDHRIWTCFVRAASLCQEKTQAMILLKAMADAGFDLPFRFLTERTTSLVLVLDQYLELLQPIEDNAACNFVNALEDLLWAFELRATASWVFQLATQKSIYRHDLFRVADKDWGADFRKLSAGAALVGLTLWLDHMQDASLEGFPESPKSVVLITGMSEYNNVSLNSSLKAYLWEMGSPFLPCKTRTGLLIAKAHSLRMWLKDSPFCLDLELKDSPHIPEVNSMQLLNGCYIRRGLVPAFKEINERLGHVRPKKFARLALLSDMQRSKVIQVDIDGRQAKLEKLKRNGLVRKQMMKERFGRKKYIRKTSDAEQIESGR